MVVSPSRSRTRGPGAECSARGSGRAPARYRTRPPGVSAIVVFFDLHRVPPRCGEPASTRSSLRSRAKGLASFSLVLCAPHHPSERWGPFSGRLRVLGVCDREMISGRRRSARWSPARPGTGTGSSCRRATGRTPGTAARSGCRAGKNAEADFQRPGRIAGDDRSAQPPGLQRQPGIQSVQKRQRRELVAVNGACKLQRTDRSAIRSGSRTAAGNPPHWKTS